MYLSVKSPVPSKDMQKFDLRNGPIFMKEAECAETNEKYIFPFSFFDLWSILYSTVVNSELIQTLTSEARVLNPKARGVQGRTSTKKKIGEGLGPPPGLCPWALHAFRLRTLASLVSV